MLKRPRMNNNVAVCLALNKQLTETNMIISFIEIHRFCYELQGIMSAVCVITSQLIKTSLFNYFYDNSRI